MVSKEYEKENNFFQLIDSANELLGEEEYKLTDDTLICECFCVSAGDIRSLCTNSIDLVLLEQNLNLGQGCKSCLKRKDDWIDKIF